jgi:putative ABC transport system ATP-binding protein
MITLKNIRKTYKTLQSETVALDSISLSIKDGDFIAIMGKSGCGKSTLLNILGMMDKADSGSFEFNKNEISKLSESKMSDFRVKNIGYIFQEFYLIDELSVYENIALPLIYRKVASSEIKEKVKQVLSKMGLEHRKNNLAKEISGGEAQRTAIARSLIYNPALILADEPTGNLDSENSEIVMNTLKNLNKEGHTIVLVTHENDIASFAKRQIRLSDGKIISDSK